MTVKESIRLSVGHMHAFRQQLKDQLGEVEYQIYLNDFKSELRNVDRPLGVTYIEVASIVCDKIDQNEEISEDAKEIGKAVYLIAAVELMGLDTFNNWILN